MIISNLFRYNFYFRVQFVIYQFYPREFYRKLGACQIQFPLLIPLNECKIFQY